MIEPLAVACIAGGSIYGTLSLGFFLVFLGYRPGLIGLKDLLKRKVYPRTLPSFSAGAFLIAIGSALMLLTEEWNVLCAVALFGAAFAVIDALGGKRSVERESFGALLAVPIACFAAPFASPVLVLRPVLSVLSVRGLISRWEDAALCRWLGILFGFALVPVAWVAFGFSDWRFVAYCICGGRALVSAYQHGKGVKPLQIGIAEIAVSLIVVLCWGLALSRGM